MSYQGPQRLPGSSLSWPEFRLESLRGGTPVSYWAEIAVDPRQVL